MRIARAISEAAANKLNEDRVFIGTRSFGVLDGATPLNPGKKDELQRCMNSLQDLFTKCCDAEGHNPERMVQLATTMLQAQFGKNLDVIDMPTSTMTYVHVKEKVTLVQLGDSPALIRDDMEKDDVTVLTGDPVLARGDAANIERFVAARKRYPDMTLADTRAIIADDLKANRRKLNTPEGYGVLAPREGALQHLRIHKQPVDKTGAVLVMTDGLSAITDIFGRVTWGELMDHAVYKGLESVVRGVRSAEARDPMAVRYPRFKQGDDASAVLALF